MKSLILCADDYGQNTPISQAIIHLIEAKRLSATSCMTTSPHWRVLSEKLLPYKNQVDIGLHFNLTEGQPLSAEFKKIHGNSFLPLSHVLKKAYLRKLNKAAIYAECHAQIDQFMDALGQAPHFLDGHQHVQQFPVIRDVILDIYRDRLRQYGAYVRCVNQPRAFLRFSDDAYGKQLIIQACGARVFSKKLIQHIIPHNTSFSGVYDFNHANNYAVIFEKFLNQVENNGLIMCHPGLKSIGDQDEIAASRELEYNYFMSEDFIKSCVAHDIILVRGNYF